MVLALLGSLGGCDGSAPYVGTDAGSEPVDGSSPDAAFWLDDAGPNDASRDPRRIDAGSDAGPGCAPPPVDQWVTAVPRPFAVRAVDVAGDGVVGAAIDESAENEAVVLRLDSSGRLRWATRLEGTADTVSVEVRHAATGDSCVAATTHESIFLTCLSDDGAPRWGRAVALQEPWTVVGSTRLTVLDDGTVVAVASVDTRAIGGPWVDALLVVRIAADGTVLSTREVDLMHRRVEALEPGVGGSVFVSVTTKNLATRIVESPFGPSLVPEAWIAEIDAEGELVTQRRLTTAVGGRHLIAGLQYRDGGLRLVGTITGETGSLFGSRAPWLVDLSPDGSVRLSVAFAFPLFGSNAESVHGDAIFGADWRGHLEGAALRYREYELGWGSTVGGGPDDTVAVAAYPPACDELRAPELCGATRADRLITRFGPGALLPACLSAAVKTEATAAGVSVDAVTLETAVSTRDARVAVDAWLPGGPPASVETTRLCFAGGRCPAVLPLDD